ncbi:MAG: KR domain-containing protein [Pirellula sp.]|nr:KR domain-containing protein [Pirellula sp.]
MISNATNHDAAHSKLPANQQPLAIVGMGCRLPGGGSLTEYWNLVASGQSAIRELPFHRLDQSTYYSPEPCVRPRTITRLGGIVSPYHGVRNLYHLTSSEIRQCDPAHLELFGVMDDAVESAGWDVKNFECKKTGVYLGHTRGTGRCGEIVYRTLIPQTAEWLRELDEIASLEPIQQDRIIAKIVADVQNRYVGFDHNRSERLAAFQAASLISKGFRLNGPSLSLNAACASSLAALSYAGEALSVGDIDVAVVGCGSFVEFDSLVLFSRAGSVSKTGSRPFDAAADGLIPAEGYVILLVKTLERALQDNDSIMAIIRGYGYSSDGKGKSLWAPREEGQILAIQRAYGNCLTPTRLGYLEAHATSTAVGDATEMRALTRALAAPLTGCPKVPVGSVKANIGHTLETAGLAALVKAVLAIQHAQIPPVANVKTPNPNIDWDNSPLYLPRELSPWNSVPSQPRRAGVNAFGIGGLNAHVILEEFLPDYADQYFHPDPECDSNPSSVSMPVSRSMTDSTSTPEKDLSQLVAIVGVGAIAPGGKVADDFWHATKDGAKHFSEPNQKRLAPEHLDSSKRWPEKMVGGFLQDYQYDWRKHKVAPKQVADADPLQFMLLDAVDQAFVDTGIALSPELRKRTGVVIGSVFGGEFGNALQMGLRLPEFSRLMETYLKQAGVEPETIESLIDRYQTLLLSRMPALNDETGSFTSSTLASRITKTFDVMGGGSAIDSGNASGITSLQIAVNSLRSRNADLMVCACGQRSIGPFNYELLCHSGALSPSGKASVGSNQSDGLVPGEGAAVVVLKRLDEAIRDGNKIYSVIKGFEQVQLPSVKESFTAVDRSLAKWLTPGELAYVEVDANGCPEANEEFYAIQSELTFHNQYRVPVAALKEQIGETCGASALLSVIRASKALQLGVLPAAASADEKRLPRHLDSLSTSENKWDPNADTPASVIVHSSSDGLYSGVVLGNIASVVKSSATSNAVISNAAKANELHPAWRELKLSLSEPADQTAIFRFGADSVSELLHQLQTAIADPTPFLAIQHRQQQDNGLFSDEDPNLPRLYRLSIVAGNRKTLKQKMSLAENALSQGKSITALQNQGIFFGERGSHPGSKTAFVFAGQGSQYPKMLASFLKHPSIDGETINQIERATKKWIGLSFEDLVLDRGRKLGTELLSTQFGILGCEVLLLRVLEDMGIRPDFLAGHSFGEYAAIYAAGSLDIPGVFEAAAYRAQAVAQASVMEGQLVCLFCDEETVLKTISELGLDAHIANCNSPQQTVVGVPKESLDNVRKAFEARRIRIITLPVPFAFHTPLMASASTVMAERVAAFPINAAERPLLSTVTETFESNADNLRKNLCDQFVKPVRWTRLVQRLRQDNTTLFVEVGPGQVLTGLTRSIFKGNEDVYCIATDDPRTSTEEQLLAVLAVQEIHAHRARTDRHSNHSVPALPTGVDRKPKDTTPPLNESKNAQSLPNPISNSSTEPLSYQLRDASIDMDDNGNPLNTEIFQSPCFSEIGLQRTAAVAIYSNSLANVVPSNNQATAFLERDSASWQPLAHTWRTSENAALRLNSIREQQTLQSRSHLVIANETHKVVDRFDSTLPTSNEDFNWHPCTPKSGSRYVVLKHRGQRFGTLGMNECGLAISCSAPQQAHEVGSRRNSTPLIGEIIEATLRDCRTTDEAAKALQSNRDCRDYSWLLTDSSGKCLTSQCAESGVSFQPAPVAKQTTENVGIDRLKSGCSRLSIAMDSKTLQLKFAFQSAEFNSITNEEVSLASLFGNASIVPQQAYSNKAEVSWHQTANVTSRDTQHNRDAQDNRVWRIDVSAMELAAAGDSRDSLPPLGDHDRICTRIVPKLIAAHGKETSSWYRKLAHSKILILGHLPSIKSKLENWGGVVHIVAEWNTSDELLQTTASLRDKVGSFDHVIVAPSFINRTTRAANTPAGGAASLLDFDFDRDILAVYRLAQDWFSGLGDTLSPAERSFIVVTKMGGDLGLSGHSPRHIEGALTGLSKAMFLERAVMVGPDVRSHAIDFEPNASEALVAECLLREWAQETREAEVGYRSGSRYVLRSVQAPLPRPSLASPRNNHTGLLTPTSSSECWIVTGGARGVTAEIAKSLAKRCHGTIHLVGSSPIPSIPKEWLQYDDTQLRALRSDIARKAAAEKRPAADQWNAIEKAMEIERNFQIMRDAGLNFRYHACDVSSLSAVQDLVAKIHALGEPIVGVVHGAGFEKASRFASKKLPLVQKTFESKAIGALNLMNATAKEPVKTFVAFASISGRYGAIGQTDYGSANEWLTKIVARYAYLNPQCHAVALDWHSWGEVGMAARPETKHSPMLKTMRFMPVDEGVEHFLSEVELGQSCLTDGTSNSSVVCPAEVVITDWQYHKLYFPDSVVPSTAAEPSNTPAESVKSGLQIERWVKSEAPSSTHEKLEGLCLIVGTNNTAKNLLDQLQARDCQVLYVPSPTNQTDVERLGELLLNLPVNNLFWLCSLDLDAYLGLGWKKERDRLDRFVSRPQELISRWAQKQTANSRKLIVAGNAHPIAEQDRFFGQAVTPEASWLSALLDQNPALQEKFTICKTVWMSNHVTPAAQSDSLHEESVIVEDATKIHRSNSSRWISELVHVDQPDPSELPSSRPAGTWVIVSQNASSMQTSFAKTLSVPTAKMATIDIDAWIQKQRELSSCGGDHSLRNAIEGQQFSAIVNPLQSIREQSGDTITGMILCAPSDSESKAIGEVDFTKLLSQLMMATQPDSIRDVVLIASHSAKLPVTEEWLRWHSIRRGIRSALITGCGTVLDSAMAVASLSLPDQPGLFAIHYNTDQSAAPKQNLPNPVSSAQYALKPTPTIINDTIVCEVVVDPLRDPFLAQHRFRGKPLMPLVGIAELMSQSAASAGLIDPRLGITVENLYVENGLKFADDDAKSLFIKLEASPTHTKATLFYPFIDSRGRTVDPERVVATAILKAVSLKAPSQRLPHIPVAPWHNVGYPGEESVIYHGPPFRCLEKTQYFENGIIATLRGQEPSTMGGERVGTWLTPMGIIDSSLFACGVLAWTRNPGAVAIPSGIDSITIYSQSIAGHVYNGIFSLDELTANEGRFSGTVLSQTGEVLFEMTSYRATLVRSTH